MKNINRKHKKQKTKEIKRAINALLNAKFACNGDGAPIRSDDEELFNTLWKLGKDVWISIVVSYKERCGSYVTYKELEMAAKEGLAFALSKMKPTENPFAYIRRCVKGYVLDYIKKVAFPFVVHGVNDANDVQRVPLEHLTDENEDDTIEPAYEPLTYTENGFAEIEIRDIINKTLTPTEKQIALMLMEGYTPSEICCELGLNNREYEILLTSIRKKLESELKR